MTNIYFTSASHEELLAVGVDPDHIYEDRFTLTQASLTEEQCHRLIPRGTYCYNRVGGVFKCCPFLDKMEGLPNQANGFCHYLKQGDFTSPGTDLLWDSCKCCGVNDFDEDYE